MGDTYALVLLGLVLLALYYIYSMKKENMISEQAYALLSRGMNLPSINGSYTGAMYVLNAAENANTVSDVMTAF